MIGKDFAFIGIFIFAIAMQCTRAENKNESNCDLQMLHSRDTLLPISVIASDKMNIMVDNQKELIALVTIQKMIEELEPSLLGPKLEPLQVKLSELLKAEGLDEKELSKRVSAVHAGKRRLELNSFQIIANATL
jgi:hypothetical protein